MNETHFNERPTDRPTTAHCLFEQSGTFKREFIKLGIQAYDYDILNDFGETDYQIDLFDEIEKAYNEESSIFDKFRKEDLIIAFFPCTRFEAQILLTFWQKGSQHKELPLETKLERKSKIISKNIILCRMNAQEVYNFAPELEKTIIYIDMKQIGFKNFRRFRNKKCI